jgi:hypothetical protein
MLAGAIAYALTRVWHPTGAWVIPQLLALCGVVLLLFVLGEVTVADLGFAASLLERVPTPKAHGRADLLEQRAVDRRVRSNHEHSI